jgi:hypothetical protein
MEKYNKICDILIETDPITGLEKRKNALNVLILGKERKIVVDYEVVLVTPNGYLAEILFTGRYETLDNEPDFPYSTYEISALGQGIKQVLLSKLPNYPTE